MILGASALGGLVLHEAVYERKLPGVFKSPQDRLLICLLGAIVLSHLSHMSLSGAGKAIDAFLPVVVLYFLIANVVTTRNRLGIVLGALAFSAVVIASIGIVAFHTGTEIAASVRSPGRLSAVGWTDDPNILTVTLLTVVPFLFLKAERGNWFERLVCLLSLATLLYAIYQTNSRGGMLTLGAVLVVLIWRRYGVWKSIVFGAVVFIMIFKFGPSRMQEVSLAEASAHGRMISLSDGLDAFWSSPLFGVGAYGWTPQRGVLVPHSSFLRGAAEIGFVGLVIWVLIGFISLKNLAFVVSRGSSSGGSSLGMYPEAVLFGCGAFLAGSMFLPIPYYFPLYVFFALSAAATDVFVAGEKGDFVLFEWKDLGAAVLLTAGGLVGFEIFLRVTGFR
jgi:putative inorganic carbon (HCO3(-)) transporter